MDLALIELVLQIALPLLERFEQLLDLLLVQPAGLGLWLLLLVLVLLLVLLVFLIFFLILVLLLLILLLLLPFLFHQGLFQVLPRIRIRGVDLKRSLPGIDALLELFLLRHSYSLVVKAFFFHRLISCAVIDGRIIRLRRRVVLVLSELRVTEVV